MYNQLALKVLNTPNNIVGTPMITAEVAAERSGISVQDVYELVNFGQLDGIKVGSNIYVKTMALHSLLYGTDSN
ncbi:MAG: hypothetical protein A2Y24_04590 [Clostridiales bacterium GWE2_32_10]|nr:MAG: hypothetical protein A2Y24_04590 [Clostridiales bacterium GWE2_32_10]HBY21574.1 hypothetical protein [Clostridiales bacterium]